MASPGAAAELSSDAIPFADLPSARLDRGFFRLYDLDFTGAQKEFE